MTIKSLHLARLPFSVFQLQLQHLKVWLYYFSSIICLCLLKVFLRKLSEVSKLLKTNYFLDMGIIFMCFIAECFPFAVITSRENENYNQFTYRCK